MTIANILKPWSFTNNTETADAVKVNADLDGVYAGTNEVINSLNSASGSKDSLAARLAVSLNSDGTLKATAIPVGTYDPRTVRVINAATPMDERVVTEFDSILMVDTTAGDIGVALPVTDTAVVSPTIVNTAATGYSAVITPDVTDTVMGLESVSLSVGGESIRLTPRPRNWWRTG
jgi:hypothetical protein